MNYLVDPDNITKYDCSQNELELLLLFWICAAGKKAHTAAKNLCRLLEKGSDIFNQESPFSIIAGYGEGLPEALKANGIGCYNNKGRSMMELAHSGLDLKSCSLTDLENVRGIGPKTARCFIVHSRHGARHAGLDTHVLKYLRDHGVDAPKSTPSGRKYLELEREFLRMAEESGKDVAEFDLEIWRSYRVKESGISKQPQSLIPPRRGKRVKS